MRVRKRSNHTFGISRTIRLRSLAKNSCDTIFAFVDPKIFIIPNNSFQKYLNYNAEHNSRISSGQ